MVQAALPVADLYVPAEHAVLQQADKRPKMSGENVHVQNHVDVPSRAVSAGVSASEGAPNRERT